MDGVGNYFDGVVANVNFTSGWVSSDGAVNPSYPIDDPDNVARNSNAALGSELWDGLTVPSIVEGGSGSIGSYDVPTTTMSNTNIGSSTGYPRFRFDLGLVTGSTYTITGLLTGDITKINQIRLATSGSTATLTYDSGTGVFSGIVAAEGDTLEFLTNGQSLTSLGIDSLSIKEAPGYGTYENFETDFSDRELFTLVGDDWLGAELWTGADSFGTGWVDDGGGVYSCDGSQTFQSDLRDNSMVGRVAGRDYFVEFTVTNYVAGDVRPMIGDTWNAIVSENGSFTTVIHAANTFTGRIRGDTDFDGTVSEISFKRTIQAP